MKLCLRSILSIVALFSAFTLSAQNSSVTGHAAAEVIMALTATETASLNFGRFSPETSGGEIRLTPDGQRVASGTVALSGGSYNPAVFYLTGQEETAVTIILPIAPAILTNSETGKTMEVGNWDSNPSPGTGTGILNQGWLNINLGATLKVGNRNDNPAGKYTGTYSVTFSYN
jgi:hypothetical protein